MKKRLLASLLSLCLLVGLLPTAALAADEAQDSETPAVCTELDGCIEDAHDEGCPLYVTLVEPESTSELEFYSDDDDSADYTWYGDGSAESFEISSAAELLEFSELVNGTDSGSAVSFEGKTVSLSDDIDLSGESWTPIGTSTAPFKGTFDGGSYTISNLTIKNGNANHQGLFGFCQNATLKNVSLSEANILCDYRGGVLAGVVENTTIEDVDVTGSEITGKAHVGGLIGRVQGSNVTTSVTNCSISNTDVSAMSKAESWDDTVDNVSNNSTDSTTPFNTRCGGITSITVNSALNITDCTLTDVNVKSYGYAGGVLGVAFGATAATKIESTTFDGTVFSRSSSVAGLVASATNGTAFSADSCIVKATLIGKTTDDNETYMEYPFSADGKVANSTAEVVFTYKGVLFPSGTAENCEVSATFQQGSAEGITSNFYGFHQYEDDEFKYTNCTGTVTLPVSEEIPYLATYSHASTYNGSPTYENCALMINFPSSATEHKVYRSGNNTGGTSVLYVDFNREDVEVTANNYNDTAETNAIGVLNGGKITSDSARDDSSSFVDPVKEGAVFAGWYDNKEFTGNSVTAPEISKTYYAKWIELTANDISMEYGSKKDLSDITIDGVTLTGWTSADNNVVKVEDNKLVATGVGKTTITANASLNRSGEELTVNVKVTPRKLTYYNKDNTPQEHPGSITYTVSDDYQVLSDLLTFKWKDDPNTEIKLTEGTDIDYTYSVPVESGGSGMESTVDFLPLPVGTYSVKFNLTNPNYTFASSSPEESTQNTLIITINVTAANMSRAYLANIQPTGTTTFAYDGQGKLPVTGTLTAYKQDSTSAEVVDGMTFTIHVEGLNDTVFHSKAENVPSGTDVTAIENLELPTKPGAYVMTVSAENDSYYIYKSQVITITKATVTITPNDKTAYVGDELPTLGPDDYTVTGLVGNDTLSAKPTLAYDGTPDMSKAGTYTITASGAAADETHYTLVYQDGTLTVRTRSSGGGGGGSSSGSTGNVTGSDDDVNINVSGSSVTAAQMEKAVDRADRGETITIEVSGRSSVSLPSSGLQDAADNNNDVTVELKNGEVTLSPEALSAVADQAGTTVTLTVEPVDTDELNRRQQAAVGDAPVFDLTLKSGGRTITDFDGGLVTVAIPYELPDGQDPAGVVVWFMDDNGNITACETMYDLRTEMVIFTTRHFSKYVIGYEAPMNFTDVSANAYYADAVKWAVANGITSGTGDGTTFSPDMSCTRAQMVTFLWRAAGSPKATGSNPFTDVQTGSYYYDAVLWAAEQGITSGTSATTFSPDAVLTRGQTVTFLYRANGSPAVSGGSFADVDANAYYADAVAWAVREGITSGTGNNAFSPDADCTRGQIVTFMFRSAN